MTLLRFILYTIAIMIAAYLVPGVHLVGLPIAIVVAVVLGALNLIIRPIIIILTLPVNILTLGLFTLVINALLVLLADAIVPGISIDGFWAAVWFSLVLTIVNSFLKLIIKEADQPASPIIHN